MKGNTAVPGPLEMLALGSQAPHSEEAQASSTEHMEVVQPPGPPAENPENPPSLSYQA